MRARRSSAHGWSLAVWMVVGCLAQAQDNVRNSTEPIRQIRPADLT